MNGHNRTTGRKPARRFFKLAATTAAIRTALAASAAVLALSGSGLALAGTCVTDASTISCDGVFVTPVPDAPLLFGLDDLTVILGAASPTSVTSTGVDGIQMTALLGSASLINSGAISTYGGADANAIDITAYGDISLVNSGAVSASAEADSIENVTAVSAYSVDGNISIENQATGSITATAGLGDVTAVEVVAGYGSIAISNAGDIQASGNGYAATGVRAEANGYGTIYPAYSDVTLSNSGSIGAELHTEYGVLLAAGVFAYGENVTVDNSGLISAVAQVELGNSVSVGVISSADTFSTVNNSVDGSITSFATSGEGVEYGADAFAYGVFAGGSSSLINNAGLISAEAVLYGDGQGVVAAVGAQTYSAFGFSTIVNSGDIDATAVSESTGASYAFAYGTNSTPEYTYLPSAASVVNSGSISANAAVYLGNAVASGTTVFAYYAATYNDVDSTISAYAYTEFSGRSDAVGVTTVGFYYAHDVNSGTISAYAVAHGLNEDGERRFTYGASNATGIVEASGPYGGAVLVNYGDISATAVALDSRGFFYGGARSVGVDQYGKYYAGINNYGDINASSSTNLGLVSAYGIYQEGRYEAYLGNHEGSSITAIASSASAADDYAGGRAFAIGVFQTSQDSIVYNFGLISSSATVDANDRVYGDSSGQATAYGTYQRGYTSTLLKNYGDIAVDASADSGYATAYGARGIGRYSSDIANEGTIAAQANAQGGNALALGAYVLSPGQRFFEGCAPDYSVCYYSYAGGYASIDNQGDIMGVASASDGTAYGYGSVAIGRLTGSTVNSGSITGIANAEYGTSTAAGSITNSFFGAASLVNSGAIRAEASGDYATAIGALVIGSYGVGTYGGGGDRPGDVAYDAARVTNSGSISAIADGYYSSLATGLEVTSRYNHGLIVDNLAGGTISATALGEDATATAVSLNSNFINILNNAGSISALGDGLRIAIASNDVALARLYNDGTITGSILTGRFDDVLYNNAGGVWNALGESDFGAGNDGIFNAGTINMTDAVISLGSDAGLGNEFVNSGTLSVSGDNLIDMGTGPDVDALVPSLNVQAFYNYGVIDFQDGAADDTLTIVGDFGGSGDINVDVSGLTGASDLLYIDGSVIDGSVSTINVELLDLSRPVVSTGIAMVQVSGISAADDFVLGEVNFDEDNSFLTLDFSLLSSIDASGAAADVFSLAIDVTGLTDPGTLAASVAPGVQSLMNTQVGTWRQRMGVINSFNNGAVSLWARVFQDKGSFNPEHVANNFGQGGNFEFDQKNSGIEAGVDFAISDEFSLGLLLAKAKGEQDLSGPGVGSSDIDGDTYGVYGTWISPAGFYVDASYRWMSFNVDLTSVAGLLEVDGDAETFNLEAGYTFTLANGMKLEPQFQYTLTSVDEMDLLTSSSGMEFQIDGGDSSRARLGFALSKGFGDANNGTLWTPYAALSAVREFDGENSFLVNGAFDGTTSIEGTSALVELGATAQTGNLSVYGGLNWQDGGAMNSFVGGQLGVRYTFGGAQPVAVAAAPAAPVKTCADLDDDGDGINNCDDKCPDSTAGQAVGPDGCPVPLTIDLKGVNFDFDKSTLRPEATAILDEAIAILARYPQLKVEVAGHTDSIGSEIYNQGLSERRAQAVHDYLGAHGVDASRMVGPTGYGETRPIAPNTNEDGSDNPEGRARNRRTELNVQN